MALLVAMLMGAVLLAGSSGLMIRQIMARKLGAAESYQQMAENAALSGLNRIIGDLNRNDRDNYTWIFTILLNNRRMGKWLGSYAIQKGLSWWMLHTSHKIHQGLTQQEQKIRHQRSSLIKEQIRADGVPDDIQVSYRLRSYDTTAAAGEWRRHLLQLKGL